MNKQDNAGKCLHPDDPNLCGNIHIKAHSIQKSGAFSGSPMQASDWNAVCLGDDCIVNGFLQLHTFENMQLKVNEVIFRTVVPSTRTARQRRWLTNIAPLCIPPELFDS